jgi:hypothetical protein
MYMKLVYIYGHGLNGLTLGKVYDVEVIRDCYCLTNDNNMRRIYSTSLFKTLDEVRNEKIDLLLCS